MTRSTSFFDVIKEESIAEPEATMFAINNEAVLNIDVKREYIKEEIDIPWNETSYIVAREQEDPYFSEKHMFNARVIIDRLPDILVKKRFRGKIKTIGNHQNNAEECPPLSIVDKPPDIIVNKNHLRSKIKTIENHQNSAKECSSLSIVDKPPDMIVKKQLRSRIKTIEVHQNSAKNRTSLSINQKNVTVKTRKSSRDEAHRNETNASSIDKVPPSHFFWKLCLKCNKKYKYIQRKRRQYHCLKCNTSLIFECKRCQKQLPNLTAAKYHVTSQCIHRGYYYKCFECDYKAPIKAGIASHVRTRHPTMTSQMHRIQVIESNNVQDEIENAKKKFECPTCEKKFEFISTLIKHVQICTGKKGTTNSENECTSIQDLSENVRKRIVVYCGKCDKGVPYDDNTLQGDQKRNKCCPDCKSMMTYKCSECPKQYVSRNGASGHIRAVHNDRQAYKCPKCDFKTPVLEHISVHYKNMHVIEIDARECSKCGKKFNRRSDWYVHSRRCGVEPPYSCEYCSFKSFTKYILSNHLIYRHSTNTESDCPKCKLTFKNQRCMEFHERLCGKQPQLECAHCPFKTKYKNALKFHLLRMHSDSNEIECPNCKKMHRNKRCLEDHLRSCNKTDYVQCNFCSFKTKVDNVLRNHILRRHAKGKDTCSFVGSSGKSYNITVKEYCCDHCSYKTNLRTVIYDHIVKHHLREDNIICLKCKETFQNSVYLKTHLKYCGLRPHLHCKQCDFKTYLKGRLAIHTKDNHMIYECSECKKQFKGLSSVRSHQRRTNCVRTESSRKLASKQKSL